MRAVLFILSLLFLHFSVSCSDDPVQPTDSGEEIFGDQDDEDEDVDEQGIEYCCLLTFGGLAEDGSYTEGISIVNTGDGGYVIAGKTTAHQGDFEGYNISGQSRAFLMKLNRDLETEWIKTIGGAGGDTVPYNLIATSDGGFAMSGHFGTDEGDFAGRLRGNHGVFIWKTDAAGNMEWLQTYVGTDWEYGRSVSETSDGGYIVTGYSHSDNLDFRRLRIGRNYIFLLKLNGNGNSEWIRSYAYSSQNNSYGYFVKEAAEGGFFVTGSLQPSNPYLLKTDASGEPEWVNIYSEFEFGQGSFIHQLDNGNLLIAGNNVLMKTDSEGKNIWQSEYRLAIHSVILNSDDSMVLTGVAGDRPGIFSEFNIYFNHLYMVKFSPDGGIVWKNTIGGDHWEQGNGIVAASDGGYIVTGFGSSDERVLTGMKKGTRYMLVAKVDEEGQLTEIQE